MDEQENIPVNLAQRLVFTLNQYQTYLARRLKEYNLGSSEYPVLIYLVHREMESDGPFKASQSDIAQRQHRDPALITRAARSLAAKGLITVNPDPDNRARNILRLTPAGHELALKVEQMVTSWEEQAQSALSESERTQLGDLLARLTLPK